MEITQLLRRLQDGDNDAMHDVIPLVYDNLKNLARSHLRHEASQHHLETTALVHEAFLRFARGRHPSYENRGHFYGIASRLMRQVLIDSARRRAAEKRSAVKEVAVAVLPDRAPEVNQALLLMDEALQRLEKADPLKVRIVEMHFFGGMTAEETATELFLPVRMIRRELRLAHAWLRREMTGEDASSSPSTSPRVS
jgi:RNA polymerase sigma-70 factor, ECF subfamily